MGLRPFIPRFDFTLAVTAVYAGVLGYLAWTHVLWGDEAQQWLIARASNNLVELYHNRRYEGHPLLWYLILYPFAHLSNDIEWIKLPAYVIAVAACYLTCRHFLAGWMEKALFPFGALMIFYFGVLTRPYMLGYLLIVLICLALRNDRRVTALLLIGVLANVHLYFLIIAGCLLAYALWVFGARFYNFGSFSIKFRMALATTVWLFILSAVQIVPPASSVYLTPDYRPETLWNAPVLMSLAVLPPLKDNLGQSAGLIMIGALVGVLYRIDRRCGLFAAIASLSLLLFQSLCYGGGAWHAGTVTVSLYAAVFLSRDRRIPVKPDDAWLCAWVFTGLLALQFGGGVFMMKTALTTPCSYDKAAARFIASYCTGCTLVADQSASGLAISAYLGGRPIYYVNERAFGTYQILDGERFHPHGLQETVEASRRFHDPVMILSQSATPEELQHYHLVFLREFTGGMTSDKPYYIYAFAPGEENNPSPAAPL